MNWLLRDRWALALITVIYAVMGIVFVRTGYVLHDEGLLTHYWASWARQDFVPVFFVQKVKPVLAALYIPFSTWGVDATMYAHVAVSSLAIPMTGMIARSLGHQWPNLAPIVVAFSPIFFYGGATGISNVDGATGVTAVLYLLAVTKTPLIAGLLAGTLPWVRFELAVFCLCAAIYAAPTQVNRRFLIGLVVFPILYVSAGALYHRDPLWIIHFPPSAPFDPTSPIYRHQLIGLRWFFEPMLAVAPTAALLGCIRWSELKNFERFLLGYLILAVSAVHVLPLLHFGNFGASPRYSIHVLPALAIIVGRIVVRLSDGEKLPTSSMALTAVIALWLITRQVNNTVVVPFLVAYGIILFTARTNPGPRVVAAVLALTLTGPLIPVRAETTRARMAPYLAPIVSWLDRNPEFSNRTIYTNSQLLAPFLESRGRPPGTVYYLPGRDMMREQQLTNPNNGQRARLQRFAREDLYGKLIIRPVHPTELPEGTIVAMRKDIRIEQVFPEPVWQPHLKVLDDSDQHRIAVVIRKPGLAGQQKPH